MAGFVNARGRFVSAGKSLTTGIGKATTAMGGFSVATVGATAGIAALAAAGAGLVKTIQFASSLQSRLAEVATISDEVAGNIKGFANEIGKLSIATRTESGLLAEGLYQTISSGITDTSDAFKVLETSANAARAGLTSVDVAVDAVTSAINAYGLQASDANRISDAYFKTVEVGKLRFEDIGRSIGSVAPLASQLGVDLEELLAAGSALTLTGKSLSEAFTGIRGAMTAILRPSSEAADLAAELGIDFSAAALKTKGFEVFLRDLAIQTGNDIEILGKLFGEVEGLQAVLSLTGNQADTFTRSLRSIENAAGSTQKAVAIQNKTLQAQVDLLKTQLSFALQTIGEELLPTVTSAVNDLNAALEDVDWKGFREDVNSTIETMRGFFDVLGDIVLTGRIAANPVATVRTGIAAGPLARAGLATGDLPTLIDEMSTPGGGGGGVSNRQGIRELALQFSKVWRTDAEKLKDTDRSVKRRETPRNRTQGRGDKQVRTCRIDCTSVQSNADDTPSRTDNKQSGVPRKVSHAHLISKPFFRFPYPNRSTESNLPPVIRRPDLLGRGVRPGGTAGFTAPAGVVTATNIAARHTRLRSPA